jgi:hypothetical protein
VVVAIFIMRGGESAVQFRERGLEPVEFEVPARQVLIDRSINPFGRRYLMAFRPILLFTFPGERILRPVIEHDRDRHLWQTLAKTGGRM